MKPVKRVVIHEEYCMGCRLCEVHCLVRHSKSRNLIKAFRQERGAAAPAVRVEQQGYVSFALQCRHCDDAPCIEACMTGAMRRDPASGAVLCDAARCVGCWMCVMVCPVAAVRPGAQGRVASKCDLCLGADVPACVANCPNEAIVYQETGKDKHA